MVASWTIDIHRYGPFDDRWCSGVVIRGFTICENTDTCKRSAHFDGYIRRIGISGVASGWLRGEQRQQVVGDLGSQMARVTESQALAIVCVWKYVSEVDDYVAYWDELSDYDMETARAMLASRRYLYVGFMCHQTIEKIFKAYFSRLTDEAAPFSHNLSFLAKKAGFYEQLSESQKDFLDQIEPLNIEARYPSHKERLMKSLTEDKCRELLSQTEILQKWTRQRLSKK